MLLAAALVPDTALVVPGAAGRATVLEDLRAAAVGSVDRLVTAAPDVVVVVVAAARVGHVLEGPLRPSLAAAGIDDDLLGWPVPGAAGGPSTLLTEVGPAVALLLLARAGWDGPVRCALVETHQDARSLRELGRSLTAGRDRVALLLVGSLSARRGPDGPGADDARAPAFDEAALADLVRLGGAGDDEAGARLGSVDPELAADLMVSAWAPWQVLLGASGRPGPGQVRWSGAPFGATYAVVDWVEGPA